MLGIAIEKSIGNDSVYSICGKTLRQLSEIQIDAVAKCTRVCTFALSTTSILNSFARSLNKEESQ